MLQLIFSTQTTRLDIFPLIIFTFDPTFILAYFPPEIFSVLLTYMNIASLQSSRYNSFTNKHPSPKKGEINNELKYCKMSTLLLEQII